MTLGVVTIESLRRVDAVLGTTARTALIEHHASEFEALKTALVSADADMVPILQALASYHREVHNLLTAGA